MSTVLLLNHTDLMVNKTTPVVFRDRVMPLFYSAFDHENVAVQENALQHIPKLCGILDFSHVKDKLLPKLTTLFSKTKTLSVKVSSLVCQWYSFVDSLTFRSVSMR